MRKYSLLLFLILPFLLAGQDVKTLTQNFETVFKDLRPGERKQLVEDCVNTWASSFFTETEKDSVTVLFKQLQDLRLSLNPDLVSFVRCINTFSQKNEKDNFLVWIGGVKTAINAKERRNTMIKNYLQQTSRLICENVLYSASSHKWLGRGKYMWTASPDIQVSLTDADIICATPKDSVYIYTSAFALDLGSNWLNGRGGRVKWNSKDTVFADLSAWQIDMNTSGYTADSVWFTYKTKYRDPLYGKLRDNASKYTRGKDKPFPEFETYSTDIQIDSIFPSVFFRGGIAYAGLKFSGFGREESPACIHITPNDTIHVYVYSKHFSIDSLRILGNSSRVEIPLHKDLFSHTDINFVYTMENHTVVMKRITEQSLHLPFRDDYHKILFDVEQIVWPIDSIIMDMSMTNRSGLYKATIESLNFFSNGVFDNLQGLDDINPLNGLHKASVLLKNNTFTLMQYAELMKRPVEQLRKQIITLSYSDFLNYDERNDRITLKQRLFDYTNARAGLRDYDDIRFDSHPKQSRINAQLNLKNYDLKIFGVDKFTISKTKDIYVEPSDKCLVMKGNRDMEFNGKLKAGMFDMFGSNLYFSYEKYKIDLTKVDSTGMYLADKGTGKRGIRVNSTICDVTGDILIDKPGNKSGKDQNSGFPTLNSTKESYVYFEEPAIRNGAYKRDSFYFVVAPYTLKDINDGSKVRYAFKGTLVSNIVPDIKDTLLLMKDNTLGLSYSTPAKGLKLYNRGNIVSKLSLSHAGLVADGDVELNKSNFQSKEVVLMPDSMLAETKLIDIAAISGQRPDARGEQIGVRYLRRTGNLQVTSQIKPFDMYKGRVKHAGTLFVYDQLINGAGQLELKGAMLKSKLFNLKAQEILSEHSDLQLSSFANKNIQLNTSDVKADIDLANNKGKFINNTDANQAKFPSNRYACSFRSFVWYMNEAYLNIGIEDPKELARLWHIENDSLIPVQGRNFFVSTDKKNDSLSFIAPLAKYDLNTGDISCQWVNHVDVANGRFYPDKGNIFIAGNGDIREFTASTLLCERMDSSKLLTNVTFRLIGRNNFDGSGDFNYVSEEQKITPVRFTQIATDSSRCIYAKADITPENEFRLNEGLAYKGNIFLYSRKPDLFFRGYAGLSTADTYLKHKWLKVNTFLDSKKIKIPVEAENRDDQNQRIFNGVYLNVDKVTRPYATFQSTRKFYNDDLLIGGKGLLVWERKEKKYVISDTLADKYYHFSYDPAANAVLAFGKLDFNLTCPGIVQASAGRVSYDFKEEELSIDDLLYMVDFELLKKMEAVMVKDFAGGGKAINIKPGLVAKLNSLFGKAVMPGMIKYLSHSSNNVPDSLAQLLVMDSLHFGWNEKQRAYRADGKTNVIAMRKKPVDKEMNISAELVRRRAGNELYLYLYDDQMWYYFEYTGKTLFTLSSNFEYNSILQNEKADKKIIYNKDKQVLYTITLCPDSKRERFLKRFKQEQGKQSEQSDEDNLKDDKQEKEE